MFVWLARLVVKKLNEIENNDDNDDAEDQRNKSSVQEQQHHGHIKLGASGIHVFISQGNTSTGMRGAKTFTGAHRQPVPHSIDERRYFLHWVPRESEQCEQCERANERTSQVKEKRH